MAGFFNLDRVLGRLASEKAESEIAVPQQTGHAPRLKTNPEAYPPVDPGIPFRTVDELLGTNQDLIDRIQVCYGMGQTAFEQDIYAIVRRYAEFVHLLPATPDNYFNVPGGMLRMGLEVAFFALQGTDGHIFSGRSTISVRRHLEPRWRHATFIAGLCSEMHRTLSHVIVTNEKGDEWRPYLQPLAAWLSAHSASRFYLKWRPNALETRSLGVFVLPHVISSPVLQHLATDNDSVVPHMMAAISGMPTYRENNVLHDLVKRSVALVIDRFLQTSADRYGTPQLGSHLERYLVDAMRRLVDSHSEWKPNAGKSRIWFGQDGLFAIWPNAALDIRKLLENDQFPGIPKAPETMLEILIAAGVVEQRNEASATWQIAPPEAKTTLEAVKFATPAVLFAGLDAMPTALTVQLVRKPDSVQPTQPASPPSVPAPVSDSPSAKPVKAPPVQQLPLPIDEADQANSPDAKNDTPAIPDTTPVEMPNFDELPIVEQARPIPRFALDAPMRLAPTIREVLAQIVDTLNNEDSPAAACTVATGLFIPLAELSSRQIDPSLAMRALTELHMLIPPNGSKSQVHSRDFGGKQHTGLILHPRHVAGLDPAHFAIPSSKEGKTC